MSAASANAAQVALTSATASLPAMEMLRRHLPNNCCLESRLNTFGCQNFLLQNHQLFSRAMKAHTDDWVAMEDEDDEGEEEDGEEVMKVLFGEEEDEETDIESTGEEVEVFELF